MMTWSFVIPSTIFPVLMLDLSPHIYSYLEDRGLTQDLKNFGVIFVVIRKVIQQFYP